MSRENSYKAFVLKKQPFGEGDEIITFYTFERGKIRALAKSTKFAKSKLQYQLQSFFLADLTVAGFTSLPKVIHAQAQETYSHLRESLEAVQVAYYAAELLLKFTVDEESNEQLFTLYEELFKALNESVPPKAYSLLLAKFKIELLEAVGFGIHYSEDFVGHNRIGFSNSKGGFGIRDSADLHPVDPRVYQEFLDIKSVSFIDIVQKTGTVDSLHNQFLTDLHILLSEFIVYHLEREVKSEGLMNMI